MLPAFRAAYEKKSPPDLTQAGTPRQRQFGGGAKGALPEIEDKLFFILVYHKTHPLQTLHGWPCGMSQPQAHFWMHRLLPILQHALRALGEAPERDARRVAVRPVARAGGPHLQGDGTERRRQRPQDDTQPKAHSSGTKQAQTDKHILVVQANTQQVVYVSPTVPGKTHDKKATDAAHVAYPTNATLDKDTGFPGYEPAATLTTQPKKSLQVKS